MDLTIHATLLRDLTFKNDKGEEVKYHQLVLHLGEYEKKVKLQLPEVVLIESLISKTNKN